ncbi:SDR family NAD(P)-dependent oxidoreductase [Geodermatophilus sp. URMC 63]
MLGDGSRLVVGGAHRSDAHDPDDDGDHGRRPDSGQHLHRNGAIGEPPAATTGEAGSAHHGLRGSGSGHTVVTVNYLTLGRSPRGSSPVTEVRPAGQGDEPPPPSTPAGAAGGTSARQDRRPRSGRASSASGRWPQRTATASPARCTGATKAAVLSLVESLNAEESGNGVSATAIAPGFVETDMSAWTTDTIPADQMINVSDVVDVVDMLLRLSRNVFISRIVMARAGSSGHET